MSGAKELAYRYDLFVAPEWRERFDAIVAEHVNMPKKGRILEVNCGTGSYSLGLAAKLGNKGEVIGVDPEAERLDLARAKVQVQKLSNVAFHQGLASDLPFSNYEFDAVIGDGSMLRSTEIEDMLSEMIRVATSGATLVLKLATRGSFDEFFSIYWEALLTIGIVDEVWSDLEDLINERITVSDAEQMAERCGLRNLKSASSREEFRYEDSGSFIDSPLIRDNFLGEWLEIVPEGQRAEVIDQISSIIERDRRGGPFEISVKATVVSGVR